MSPGDPVVLDANDPHATPCTISEVLPGGEVIIVQLPRGGWLYVPARRLTAEEET